MNILKYFFSKKTTVSKKIEKYPEFKTTCPYWILRKVEENVAHLVPVSQKFKKEPKKIITSKIINYDKATGRIETKNTVYLKWPPVDPKYSDMNFIELFSIINRDAPRYTDIQDPTSPPLDFDFTIDNGMAGMSVEEVATELDCFLRQEQPELADS